MLWTGRNEMKKAYSHNEEDWEEDWGMFLDDFKNNLGIENDQDLIGEEYFECDQVPVETGEMVDIDAILDIIQETAWDVMGEYGEDYPDLTSHEKIELKGMIIDFLDKKDGRGVFNVKNLCKKTITAEDVR
jgi:hypothetical protein